MSEDAIAPEGLRRRLDAGERLTLLDVREPFERAYCSIAAPPGVADIHIPMGQVPARLEEIRGLAAPVIVYCHHGVRSAMVQGWLRSQGLAGFINLDGGIDAWSLRGDRDVPRYG